MAGVGRGSEGSNRAVVLDFAKVCFIMEGPGQAQRAQLGGQCTTTIQARNPGGLGQSQSSGVARSGWSLDVLKEQRWDLPMDSEV